MYPKFQHEHFMHSIVLLPFGEQAKRMQDTGLEILARRMTRTLQMSPLNPFSPGSGQSSMARIRQSRPDFGLGFQVKVLKSFQIVPF